MTFDINNVEICSVSTGTLLPRDLAPTFATHAEYLGIDLPQNLKDAVEAIYDDTYDGDADEIVNELSDLIGDELPSFLRFGAHEGDGSDFGVWGDERYGEDLIDALLEVEKAKVGDSNDGEIAALTIALDLALEQIGWH